MDARMRIDGVADLVRGPGGQPSRRGQSDGPWRHPISDERTLTNPVSLMLRMCGECEGGVVLNGVTWGPCA